MTPAEVQWDKLPLPEAQEAIQRWYQEELDRLKTEGRGSAIGVIEMYNRPRAWAIFAAWYDLDTADAEPHSWEP